MTSAFDVVVPVLTLRTSAGGIDFAATRTYAQRAAASWVDYFIVSGSTTQGQMLTSAERADVLDLWLDTVQPGRLLACCWEDDDIGFAAARLVPPMITMRSLSGRQAALKLLRELPAGAYIYSHPMFGGAVFDADLAAAAMTSGILPSGGKLAKVTLDGLTRVHQATAGAFRAWDGSSRHISESLAAGAAGIVATPLCAFSGPLPAKDSDLLQAAIDPLQAALDALPDRPARTVALLAQARL
jgi:dihydrodipicolinate synthase/N-acetylneuraminate lyase